MASARVTDMTTEVEAVKQCILTYKVRDVAVKVQEALDSGVDPGTILDQGMVSAMAEIGDGFKRNTIYMPQMLMAAKTMQIGLDVLKPHLVGDGVKVSSAKAVVGSVLGDVHDIGKNLVGVMLQGAGYDVVDLGADVEKGRFLNAMDETPDVKIVAISSAMTPTREALRETVASIKERPDASSVAVMVGGATMDQMFSDEIHADIYTVDAASASERARSLAAGSTIQEVSDVSREIAYASMRSNEGCDEVPEDDVVEEPTILRHRRETAYRLSGKAGHGESKPLSIKENFAETVKRDRGCPDRLVQQYEFFDMPLDPVLSHSRNLREELFEHKELYVDGWGVTQSQPAGAGGAHPMYGDGLTIVTDITKWREQIKVFPDIAKIPSSEWDTCRAQAKEIEAKGKHVGIWMATGLFERTHTLMGMTEALRAFYENPEEMHEMIDFFTEWELQSMDRNMEEFDNVTVLFHHDDWGTAINSFLDPETHRSFFVEPYKKIFSHFRELGGEYIVHHNDSWTANLVPIEIEIGADVWQGPIDANNIPELIDRYGADIVFMGGIDDSVVDMPNWDRKAVYDYTVSKIRQNGPNSYIPCLTRGLGASIYDGVYDVISEAIRDTSKEFF